MSLVARLARKLVRTSARPRFVARAPPVLDQHSLAGAVVHVTTYPTPPRPPRVERASTDEAALIARVAAKRAAPPQRGRALPAVRLRPDAGAGADALAWAARGLPGVE